jgi:copper chaperone
MRTITITGMSCDHCVKAVEKALKGVEGVQNPEVSLKDGTASFEEDSSVDMGQVVKAVEKAG